ncbi:MULTISPECIES: DUF317 domain-containing protein [unclassified Streptomyces]|uniref:DUF317 domain-containing protein n=1 Tax=unclassified Streptomyces TaxID=2593676 RepID=UPI003323F8FD
MPRSERQLAAFADKHAGQIPFDTSPRHLAGPGDARHITHGLAVAGWQRTSDPLSPEMVLTSPDHRYSLGFDPGAGMFAWWRLWAEPTDNEHGWYASFGELAPAEIISGLTDALVTSPSPADTAPLDVLDAAGWIIDAQGAASSPDGTCRVERRAEEGDDSVVSWHIEVRDPDRGRFGPRLWEARFAARTPRPLVNAFVTALAEPSPLQRGMHERTAHYSVVQEPSPLTPKQVVEAHTARLDAIRAGARAARRRHKNPVTAPARVSTARPTVHR